MNSFTAVYRLTNGTSTDPEALAFQSRTLTFLVITENPIQKCKSLLTPVDYFYDGIAAYVFLVLDELPDLQVYGAGVTSKQNLVDSSSPDS